MRRLIVRYEKDIASSNIVDTFVARGGWAEAGVDDEGHRYLSKGDDMVIFLEHKHIRAENIDESAIRFGFRPDVVIFPSVHSAKSGIPALTVHPIGNYHEALYGGESGRLAPTCPSVLSDMLRSIRRNCAISEYNICFEATHHGPYLKTPAMFLEIGSDESCWGRQDAADVQCQVLSEVTELNDYVSVIGIGGGHYAPRFTELALSCKVNFGHMLPNYQMDGFDDEDIARSIKSAMDASGTRLAYLHRKSMKGAQASRITALAESVGCEFVKSEDFEKITEN
ncbi:MAG: D-aminoacyl-tRNA deacylase [archaeon]|nr:D-aminoacyl-tRNA deacylase [archaeon]